MTKFLMDNLVKNSFYYFRIFAENSIGISEPLESDQMIEAKPAFGNLIIPIHLFSFFKISVIIYNFKQDHHLHLRDH